MLVAIVQVWDNEDQTVMRQSFAGWWTVHEYCDVFRAFGIHATAQPHVVHYIADFSQSEGFLGNLLGVIHDLEHCAPVNIGVGVAVGAHYQTETLLTIAQKVSPLVFGNLGFATNLREAREMIWQVSTDHYASTG